MKRVLPFIIIAAFSFGKLAAQSIPNGGFENWNSAIWGDPKGYSTSNDQLIHQPGASPNVVQVAGWTAGFDGAQLTTEVINGDTQAAYINNAINNPLAGQGGIPYNQKPAQLEIWYNCNEMTGDSAAMIVVFKKSGSVLGSYIFSVTGTHTGFPSVTFPITGLSATPDSVIFAAASSINILRGGNGFPGSTFTISGIEFENGSGGVINPAEINDSLLNWTNDTVLTPQGWEDLFPESFRTGNAYSGNYALELETIADPYNGGNPTQGVATTGRIDKQGDIFGGQPYNNALKDTLDFYYIYHQGNTADSGYVLEDFIKNGAVSLQIGGALIPEDTFTHVIVVDTLSSSADSVIETFYSSEYINPNLNGVGNHLIVDDVSFRSQKSSGIKPVLMNNSKILIYPNPASTQVTVASAQAVVNEVRLVNILGQTVLDMQYGNGTATNHQNIDVSTLPAGMYFISVTSGGSTSTGKLSIVNK